MIKVDTSDYLPSQTELTEPPIGERKKAFSISPAKDDTAIILNARMEVLTNPLLSFGARTLYTLLMDLALDPRCNNWRRGQVSVSNVNLRGKLSCSAKAIYNWTAQLEEGNYVWLSKLPRPNTTPMNVFHITALQQKRQGPELAGDGLWGNGYRRPSMEMPQGARGGVGKKRHMLVDQFGNPLFAQNADNQLATRKNSHLSPVNYTGATGKNYTCHPYNLRETSVKNTLATRKKDHLPPVKSSISPVQKAPLIKETGEGSLSGSRDLEGGEGNPTPPKKGLSQEDTKLFAWRQSLNGVFPSRLEKMLNRLEKDREKASAPNVRQFIGRKIKVLRELLDGPVPEPFAATEPPRAKPQARPERQPTPEELLAGARYLVQIGKDELLTKAQKLALQKANVIYRV